MPESKNIIIGAGLSGLSCGWALRNCILLEKETIIGGLARTFQFNDFSFDLGGHRFLTYNTSVERFIRNLLNCDILKINRKSQIYKNKKLIDYPLRFSLFLQLAPWEIASSFFSYIYRKIKPLEGLSFEDKAINNFGDHLYKLFFRDYTEKVWGLNCDNISSELVDIRLQNASLIRVIKRALIKDNKIKSFADKFLYPIEGIGKISESLAKELDVRLNMETTGFIYSNNRIDKIVINNYQELPCKNLISTMPITKVVEFLNPPEDIRRAANNLKYRSLICIFLVLKKHNFSKNHWIYFPERQIFSRIHEPKNWSVCMSPKEKTGVCVEILCHKGDDIWHMADAEIAFRAIRDLPWVEESDVEDKFLVRVEYAYPVYDINYKINLDKIKKFLSSYKNLFLLGRIGSFKYINMDLCLEEGLNLGLSLKKQERL